MTRISLSIIVATLALAGPAAADVVHLKHGAKLEGRIVQRSETSVEIDIGAGTMTLPMSKVDRIEEGRSALDDYDERVAALAADDREGWLELARWASSAGLGTQSRSAYEHVLSIDPDDAEANRALGREKVDGRWMTEDEANLARGLVRFEGRWMTPGDREAILRTREAERSAAQAQARAAEAEARAAEARARQAEAEADRDRYRSPLYWSTWGPGPVDWPANPLDNPRPRGQ
jgi:hypothetical protein